MTESLRFQTRARTIDHLGREQIADCPTAISELWKNSYDAYSRAASLQIFDGDSVVAAVYDNGHGMSRDEFINKWLVVGTESKLVWTQTPLDDRSGLPYRRRQGKKGIGRLSVAYLGNLLLIVTKRQKEDYVAALIDWRVFENPFLLLDDIRIPLVTYAHKEGLFGELPSLYDTLMGNVWGDAFDEDRKLRVVRAWEAYDKMETPPGHPGAGQTPTTRARIEQTLINEAFAARHLAEWEVWSGASNFGTALLIGGVIPDLEAQLRLDTNSATDKVSREKLRSTLWSFIDPFRELVHRPHEATIEDFKTSVIGWKGEQRLPIIDQAAGFETHSASDLEHIIDGRIDVGGTFRGRVKAFGEWVPDEIEIRFEEDVPNRIDSKVGEFDFYVGTMEFDKSNTTLSDEQFSKLSNLLEQFSGLMVFRDGFRVMPYGRPDSDYFGVEERRSRNAGREFWNHRRMLGRIAISNENNPNLRDKAGREGIIDNRASKVFKAIVVNVLTTSARLYFGSASEIRKEKLPLLNEAYDAKLKQQERERILKQKRRQFRTRLEDNYPLAEKLADSVVALRRAVTDISTKNDEDAVLQLQQNLSSLRQQYGAFRLGPAPRDLSSRLRKLYADYRGLLQEMEDVFRVSEKEINEALERVIPKQPREVAENEIRSQVRHINKRIGRWINRIEALLESQKQHVNAHAKSRLALFKEQLEAIPIDVQNGRIKIGKALSVIASTAAQHDSENEAQFEPVIGALESLEDNINLDLLAGDNSEEVSGLKTEMDRLTALAQLGITVEIIDHELASFNSTIAHGLKQFSAAVRDTAPFKQVQTGYEGLANRLSFLSPLKLSGDPDYREISGNDIEIYLSNFFAADLETDSFQIAATKEFRAFNVYEQRSRVFPVFINLINNARYWLHQRDISCRRILLSAVENKVLVSDNGPGIESQDIPDLFRLFFTRRQGGRGIGLYLCRSNLTAGGHKINYATEEKYRLLPGANFIIEFKNANFPE